MFRQRDARFIFGWAHRPAIFSTVIQAFLVAAFGLIHSSHVSTMFENDTYFSHLTTLEREMIFRSEMGMYYSYYKRLVQAPSYMDGLSEIINDRKTEYPSVINSLQRFNLFPEVIIAALYRVSLRISKALDLKTVECWIVNRSYDDVTSCVGYGDPIYFYLNVVWTCAGLTMSLIFLFGLELSGSILGGTFAVLCFMFNHSESTRIQWTPPLRESFGYPCCLWQMLLVTKFLRFSNSYQGMVRNQQSLSNWLSNISRIMLPTTVFLILWQFSQFVITTQLLAVYLLYCFGVLERRTCLTVAISVAGSVVVASVILFLNEFLLYSTLTFMAMSMIIVVHLDPWLEKTKLSRAVLSTVSIAVLTLLLKVIYGNRDDAHIFNLLRTKFTDYKDFHTLLYTCSPEFDFMPVSYLKKISQTLLLPTVVFNVIAITWYWLKTVFHSGKCSPRAKVGSVVDHGIAYNFLQASAFAVMASLIMRLKLFLTPHLCLIASIIFHKQFLPRTPRPWFSAFFALLLGGMTVKGYANIMRERNIIGWDGPSFTDCRNSVGFGSGFVSQAVKLISGPSQSGYFSDHNSDRM
ncbi:protein C-mannosyl-transferase DPY19L1 isoform X2 [Anabrus simplex]|uniref:protein C-mannosyl-transferase DPY19L1 isoform X2 n=1 Tax=Anabrus simplex TaxID=316456 RepID=UPI0035A3584A